jgi:hypothetical protein
VSVGSQFRDKQAPSILRGSPDVPVAIVMNELRYTDLYGR